MKIHVIGLCGATGRNEHGDYSRKAYSKNIDDITCKFCLKELSHFRHWKQRVITERGKGVNGIKRDTFITPVKQVKTKPKERKQRKQRTYCPHCRKRIYRWRGGK